MERIPINDESLASIARSVEAGEPGSEEMLYALMRQHFRLYLIREIGQEDWEDRMHNAFLAVLQAVKRHRLKNAAQLINFAGTIVYREICKQIAVNRYSRTPAKAPKENLEGPNWQMQEALLEYSRKVQVMTEALMQMRPLEQEILRRFYLLEQTKEQIENEMHLTDRQFRNSKHRAKKHLVKKTMKASAHAA